MFIASKDVGQVDNSDGWTVAGYLEDFRRSQAQHNQEETEGDSANQDTETHQTHTHRKAWGLAQR